MSRPRTDSAPPVLHLGIGAPAKCKSCGAEIVFAYTFGGKRGPFQKDDAGDYILENGAAKYVGKPSAQLELGAVAIQRYKSHFSACPHASEWRGKGRDD